MLDYLRESYTDNSGEIKRGKGLYSHCFNSHTVVGCSHVSHACFISCLYKSCVSLESCSMCIRGSCIKRFMFLCLSEFICLYHVHYEDENIKRITNLRGLRHLRRLDHSLTNFCLPDFISIRIITISTVSDLINTLLYQKNYILTLTHIFTLNLHIHFFIR